MPRITPPTRKTRKQSEFLYSLAWVIYIAGCIGSIFYVKVFGWVLAVSFIVMMGTYLKLYNGITQRGK